jgi:outer membrane protein
MNAGTARMLRRRGPGSSWVFVRARCSVFAAITVCFAISLLAPAVRAQTEATPLPISLKEVLRRAEQNAPAVLLASATVARFDAQRKQAQGAYFPALTGQVTSGIYYDNRLVLPDVPRIDSKSLSADGTLNLDWAVLDAARGSSVDSARAQTRAQRHARKAAVRDALLLAAELYIRAQAAVELLRDAQLTVERRSNQYAAASDLVKVGTRSPLDAQRAQVEVVSAEYALATRRYEQLAAFSALAAAMGEPPTRLFQPEGRSMVAFTGTLDARQAQQLAYKNRPEIQSMRAALLARREAHDSAVGARLPTAGIAATGSLSYVSVLSGQGIDGYQYGGSAVAYLRWSGLDPTVWMQADVTESAILEAKRQLAVTAQGVMSEAVGASYMLQRAKTERDRAEAVLSAARITREAQNGRYRAGLSSLLELLDAESLEQDARERRIVAQRDHAIAGARLWAACGLLSRVAR